VQASRENSKGFSKLQVGKGKVKASQEVKAKAQRQRHQDKDKGKQREERHTKARGALLHKACGEVFKELQGIREWLLLYQVHLYMFPVLYIFL
jgi:hypothetical protein